MSTKDLNYIFNEVSLYTKEKFTVLKLDSGNKYDLDISQIDSFLEYVGANCDKLVTYCHKCKKEFPFSVKKDLMRFSYGLEMERQMPFMKGNGFGAMLGFPSGKVTGRVPPYDKDDFLENQIWYIQYYFTCTNNEEHCYMMMISIELKAGEFIVRKVGQNPSMLTIKGFDFDKYKKQLEEIKAYGDYKKADLSNADHFHVGAFAYLRRIFEKMICQYLENITLEDNHMDTKIKAVKDRFDPRIQGMLKNLYSVLSISIHELDEDTSKEYYEYLKAIIDMQLEYVKTESDKEQQSNLLSATLNKIASGIITKSLD